VYIYAAADYSLSQKIEYSGAAAYFGESIFIDSRNVLYIGTPSASLGLVLIFKHDGSNWNGNEAIESSDGSPYNKFGTVLAATTTNIIITALYLGYPFIYRYNAESYCFHDSTMVMTNNGYVNIKELKRGDLVKTLNGFKKLCRLLKILKLDNYKIIKFNKDSISENIPSEDFLISDGHPIYYNNTYYNSNDFADNHKFKDINYIELSDNYLYHLQFETHEVIYTNNLTTTSLPPYTNYKNLHLPKELYFDQYLFNEKNIGKNYEPYMLHDDPLLNNQLPV